MINDRVRCCALGCLAVAILAALPCGGSRILAFDERADRGAAAWELAPYRIAVWLQIDDEFPESDGIAANVSRHLERRTAAVIGPAWELHLGASPRRLSSDPAAWPAAIGSDDLASLLPNRDKLMILVASRQGGLIRVAARECDLSTRSWSPPVEKVCDSVRQLPPVAMTALWSAFAPLARIETVGELVELRMRGVGLGTRDAGLWKDRMPRVFRLALVEHDVGGPIVGGSAQLIPWTYLEPRQSSGGVVKCQLSTALAGQAIPDYHPRRTRLALAVGNFERSGRLRLVSSGPDGAPLVGYEVVELAADGKSERWLGATDSTGALDVAPGQAGLRWLAVRHGGAELVRIPWPGGDDVPQTLALPDDRRRYSAERELSRLRDQIVDATHRDAAGRAAALKRCAAELASIEQRYATPGAAVAAQIEPMIAEVRNLLTRVSRSPAAGKQRAAS